MWTRVELKDKAKNILRKSYWKAFGVSLILTILGAGASGNFSNSRITNSENAEILFNPAFVIMILGFVLFAFLIRIFIGYNVEVGGAKYFIKSSKEDFNFGYLLDTFKSGHYINVVITMFLRALYTFLWSLLLIIPGIIKSYAYSLVPYILSENPDMEPSEAISLSSSMTEGHKLDIFILDLSFIGWYILGGLLFGIGVLFVNPYVNATKAELYLKLKEIYQG
ncbi:DUF975 family protein [Alkaliphilus serpentinus]|uniref:DUF975 family protein n=1 Tax=Alkaliphilus serpentinus TaxID=1482731 RepID=A0A833HM94_9FIRM|nr:DUF975 family protein [Alkaliphilus serpentinus]KAB3527277.1 DUF975 family protein [Alkaliphilus serpentinus]